ncbi:Hypothetical_protein [Hexamita inflata]|uniref:Hypothetical_protein n=1 Tax=Hexamita inflata TaxID=28002 RepID=A0AA86VUC7_9EUKA|nr:Hypothetical protein HINF_LOCUS66228 [Hexamita inflata]
MIMYQQRKLKVTAQQYIFIFFNFRKLITVDCTQLKQLVSIMGWGERSTCYQQYIILRFPQLLLWQLKYQNVINFNYCRQTFQPGLFKYVDLCTPNCHLHSFRFAPIQFPICCIFPKVDFCNQI